YNRLCALSETVEAFKKLVEVRRLLLCGNPLSLTPAYRPSIVRDLSNLQDLDSSSISEAEREVAETFPILRGTKSLGLAMQVYPELFEGVPYTVADEGGGYFITIRDMQGTQRRSPAFVRDAPPPTGSGGEAQGDDDEAPEKGALDWAVAVEGAEDQRTSRISIDIMIEAFDELFLWNWLMLEGLHVELHRATREDPSDEGEVAQDASILVGRADLTESGLFIPPRVEECLPELVDLTEDNAVEAPTEEQQTGSPDGDELERSKEELDEMARHIAAGHCAVSTAAIRVPLFSPSEATTENPVAAPSPRPGPACQQMCLVLEGKTLSRYETLMGIDSRQWGLEDGSPGIVE
ncbi:hypothetical protein FOZ63_030174, partial [Perkinsus olseni]